MQNRDLMLKAVIPLALFSLVAAILSFIALEFGESGNTKLRRIAYASFFSIHYFGITLCYLLQQNMAKSLVMGSIKNMPKTATAHIDRREVVLDELLSELKKINEVPDEPRLLGPKRPKCDSITIRGISP
jgi:hypothetical protein